MRRSCCSANPAPARSCWRAPCTRRRGRRTRRFVAINCAAIPETLLESELFGYERGAFTGANKQTPGRIETANQGTLFLDEIGDLPASLQAKLLRFLQERTIERLGGREEIPVDVRIVCATHQNLRERITAGSFREDLFYRLAEIVVTVPPLRERAGDAALLAHALVRRFADEMKRGRLGISDEAIAAIERHRWPGNVRELENVIKRAVILAEGQMIQASDLALEASSAEERAAEPARGAGQRRAARSRARARARQWQPVQGRRPARRQPPDAVRPAQSLRHAQAGSVRRHFMRSKTSMSVRRPLLCGVCSRRCACCSSSGWMPERDARRLSFGPPATTRRRATTGPQSSS